MNLLFDKKTTKFIEIIAKNAQKQKVRVFFVGGLVRDFILEKEINDIDFLIEGNAIDFIKNIPEISIKSIHEPFGTLKVQLDDNIYDFASTRIEEYPKSGILPLVNKLGVKIEEDVKRRDFTINSLYIEIKFNEKLEYELIDLIDGIKDINSKQLKVLHSKSYIDDPSRIIRGVGFKHRFGFNFSNEDIILIKEYFKNLNFESISYDRLFEVFRCVLNNSFSDKIFNEIIEKKYYKIIFENEIKINQKSLNNVLNEFDMNNSQKANFYLKILENNNIERFLNNVPVEMVRYFSKYNAEQLAYYFYKTNDEKIKLYNQIKDVKLQISGDDLVKLNYPKGKLFKEILETTLNEKMLSSALFNSKEDEINWVLNRYPLN